MAFHPDEEWIARVTHTLSDAWQRINWADADGQELNGKLADLVKANIYKVRVQHDGQRGVAHFRRMVTVEEEAALLLPLARLTGSFLDHSRAGLNYLAYQLALQANAKQSADVSLTSVEFPIFTSRGKFRRKQWISQFPQKYRDALDGVQPYDGRNPGLLLLHELGRAWRHALIHPTAVWPVDPPPRMVATRDVIASQRLIHGGGALKHDDPLMEFTLIGATPEEEVHANVDVAVGVDHTLCKGLALGEVLNAIREDIDAAMMALIPLFE